MPASNGWSTFGPCDEPIDFVYDEVITDRNYAGHVVELIRLSMIKARRHERANKSDKADLEEV